VTETDPSATTVEVDALGLPCPMPVIRLAEAVEQIADGDAVRLLADDPAARVDVPVWCRMRRQHLAEVVALDGGASAFVVVKRGA
jgi:tRNA 2-thiouridine synthesizing protein A